MQGRIWFEGNPWPQGHALLDFQLGAFLHEGGVTLSLLLKSTEYRDAGGAVEPPEEQAATGDWESRGVWNNYHRCSIESGAIADQPPLAIDPATKLPVPGQRLRFDTLADEPPNGFDPQDNLLQCYILGHDAVRDHDLKIGAGSAHGLYRIDWSGRVALAYAGDYFYRYRFRVEVEDAPFVGFEITQRQSDGREVAERTERNARIQRLAAQWLGGREGLQVVMQPERLPDRLIPLFRL